VTYATELPDFTVAAVSIIGADSRTRPALRAGWSAPTDPTIAAVILEWRVKTQPDDTFDRTVNTGQTIAMIGDVVSSTLYEVRHRLITDPPRLTSWSAYVEVTTGDVGVSLIDLAQDVTDLFDDIGADLTQVISDVSQEITDRTDADAAEALARVDLSRVHAGDLRRGRDDVLALATEIADLGANAELDRQEIRTSLTVTAGALTAAYTQAITIATGPSSALVSEQTNLAAGIDGVNASIDAVNLAYAAADTAVALEVTTLGTQLRGSYTGTDWTQAGGMISQINSSITSQFESVSAAIASISAGVDEQFDFAVIWNFDATVQDWTGNGTPTWVAGGGWMRPADHGSDPYVISPAGLGVDLDTYGQVRLRIRKTGAPVWEGYLWWKRTGDTTWDAGRRVTIDEPTFDGGISVVSVDLGLTGELVQIRFDLSTAQDGADYFEIDWVAVGRSSPGASVASVNTLNQALTNGINAQASAREALSVNLTGVADPAGLTIGDLASGLIYSERVARVAADESIQSKVTSLEGSVTDLDTGLTTAGSAISALDVRVSDNEDGISTLSSDLTALTSTVDGKADVSALEDLETSINIDNIEGLSAQAVGRRALEATLLADALEAAEVGSNAALTDQAAAQANAAVRQETYARTEQNEAVTTAVAGRVDVIEATLPGKAEATYVEEVEARVTETENGITSAVEALSAVEVKADDATAAGLFKIEASAGAGDVLSRLTLYARATTGGTFESAGMVIEVVTDGGSPATLSSRIVMSADQFVVTDGTESAYPLVFEGGVLKLAVADIGNIRAGTLVSPSTKTNFDLNNDRLVFSD
jgi:hypothetical protein